MGSVLQLIAFLCISWLIRGVVTHPNENDDKRLDKKNLNQNDADKGDFYFDEQPGTDDNVKTGRAIPQSAWSKEGKPVEKKDDTQINDEFSLKSFISSLLNTIKELKKDIFGIKQMALQKNIKESADSGINLDDKSKQNEIAGNNDKLKSDDSTKNTEIKNGNHQPKSDYITDYYQKKGTETDEDESDDDDLENSSDESDDSSHKPNEGAGIQETSKSNEDTCKTKCMKNKEPQKYSLEAEETTVIPTGKDKIPEEDDNEFDDGKENEKDSDFGRVTTKPTKTQSNDSKSFREETEESSVTGRCMNKNNENSAQTIKEINEPSGKSAEYSTTKSPQNENFDKTKSNQNNTPDNLSKRPSDSTIQITTPKPEKMIESKNKAKSLKNTDRKNKPTTVSSQPHKAEAEMDDSPEKTQAKKLVAGSTSITAAYNKNEPNSETDGQSTSNTFDTDSTISPVTSENIMSSDNVNENPSDNLNETKEANKNDDLEKPFVIKQGKNDAETQKDNETGQPKAQQLNGESEPGKSLENKKLNDSNPKNKAEDGNSRDKNRINNENDTQKPSTSSQGRNDSETQGDSETGQAKEQQINNVSKPEKIMENKKQNDSIPKNKAEGGKSSDKNGINNENDTQAPSTSKQGKNDSETKGDSETGQPKEHQMNNGSEPKKSLENKKLNNSISKNKAEDGNSDGKKEINKENESSKSSTSNQGKNDSDTQGDNETGPTKEQSTNDSKPEKSSKNKKLKNSNPENNKAGDDGLTSAATNDNPQLQDSNRQVSNDDLGSDNTQKEDQKKSRNLNKRKRMHEISPDQEYENEEDREDFDISDEMAEMKEDQTGELNTNKGNDENKDENDSMNSATVLTNESQTSQHVSHAEKEESQEKYDTFLEYFYKHSNNPFFQSLKNE